MLGDQHLRVLTVRGFPPSTWPGVLDDVNRLGFTYRWSTRFLSLDKAEAERELVKVRRQWFAKRKGIVTLLRETIFQQDIPLVDSDAANKSVDADEALQELGGDAVAYGYVTATVAVMDESPDLADEKLKAVERIIQGRGFVTISETLNATEAWLSSIPGHAYANVRQPLISTLNLAHMMPVSAVWAGPEKNAHLDAPPLIVTRTAGGTPFRLVTHIDDVGHTLIVGPTGAGKSVLLSVLALQFRRYTGSRIFIFDKGGSARATILGLGGEHYDLGSAASIAFQPLAGIDDEETRAWAAEWIAGLLGHEHVEITPDVKDAVWSAVTSLASAPREERTLTGLSTLLQSNRLRQAMQPYTLSGPHGRLLDADDDRLGLGDVQGFEMEELMHTASAVTPVLTYLFHRLDERFDGSPTLLVLDEAWVFLDDPIFAARIREWLKTLRKKNVSVVFATQSLADIQRSAKRTIAETERLIAQAQGLSFDVASMEQQFKQLYPQQYTASVSGDQMVKDARARWERSRDALETTLKMQAQVSTNLSTDERNLGDLVTRSQSAAGILEATQATNQLLALQAKQAIEGARLKLAQDRAVATEQARSIAEEERAREVRRRFMGSGSSYTPSTVRLFRN